MKSLTVRSILVFVYLVTNVNLGHANVVNGPNASQITQLTQQAQKDLRNIFQLEEQKKIQFRDNQDQVVSLKDLLNNPSIAQNATIVTGEIFKGLRMRFNSRLTESALSITVRDENDRMILGRTSINLASKDPNSNLRVEFDSAIKQLANQVEYNLKSQGKLEAKAADKTNKIYATLFSIFIPSANAGEELTFSKVIINILLGGVYVCIALMLVSLVLAGPDQGVKPTWPRFFLRIAAASALIPFTLFYFEHVMPGFSSNSSK